MSTTAAVRQQGQICAHYGCGCRVTDETYCSPECESVASGQTGSAICPCTHPNCKSPH